MPKSAESQLPDIPISDDDHRALGWLMANVQPPDRRILAKDVDDFLLSLGGNGSSPLVVRFKRRGWLKPFCIRCGPGPWDSRDYYAVSDSAVEAFEGKPKQSTQTNNQIAANAAPSQPAASTVGDADRRALEWLNLKKNECNDVVADEFHDFVFSLGASASSIRDRFLFRGWIKNAFWMGNNKIGPQKLYTVTESAVEALRSAEAAATNNQATQAVTHRGVEVADFPPNDGWHFETTCFWFRKIKYDLSGYPLKLLKIFVSSHKTDFGYNDLFAAWGDDIVDEQTVRQHLRRVRESLRKVASDIKAATAVKHNPLPSHGRSAWRFLLPRI
jgi:hypothetical protein